MNAVVASKTSGKRWERMGNDSERSDDEINDSDDSIDISSGDSVSPCPEKRADEYERRSYRERAELYNKIRKGVFLGVASISYQ